MRELRTARNGKGRHGTCGRKFETFQAICTGSLRREHLGCALQRALRKGEV